MSEPEPADHFEDVSGKDSASLFKPQVVSLVVTDSAETGPNVMTAAWWMIAGYDPFRYLLGVSHETYTHEIIEANPEFVLAAPSTDLLEAFTVCGTVSGRELDKLDHLGLETVPGAEVDVPLLVDAVGNVECSVVESFAFRDCSYYFGTVEAAHVVPGGLDGRILSLDADVLAYMGSDWADPDDSRKHRYYAELEPGDLRSYPGAEAVANLPAELSEKYGD